MMAIVSVALIGGGCAGSRNVDNAGGVVTSGKLQTSEATVVTTPAPGASVSSPLRIEGTTANPDMKIFARVIDSDGAWLVTSEVMPQSDGTYLFTAVYLFSPTGPNLTLEMYNTDSTGKEINMTQVPLVLAQ